MARVFVVDDNPEVCELFARLLQAQSYDVLTCQNGGDALRKINSEEFDVVIVDLKLDGLDGMEIIRQIKRIDPTIPVIIITDHASVESAIDGIRFGAYDYLEKPLHNLDQVLMTVKRALEARGISLALKNSQEENRRLIQAIDKLDCLVLLMDSDGVINYCSGQLESLYGYKIEEIMGKRLGVVFPQQYHQQIEIILSETKKNKWEGELDNVKKDGQLFPVRAMFSPVYDRCENLVALVGIIKDITRERDLYAQLIHSENLAYIGRLAAGVAHEINNPLAVLSGTIQRFLERTEVDDRQYAKFRQMKRVADRIKGIVDTLLCFSHPKEVKSKQLNLNDVIIDMLNFLEQQLKERGIRVKKYLGNLKPLLLPESEINQVLMNLVINACDAMPQGGELKVRTSLLTVKKGKKGKFVRLEISDTGCGISGEEISKIFQPFYTTKAVGEGTGLGLAISYGIIKRHGGSIDVKSKVEKGTTFSIELPV